MLRFRWCCASKRTFQFTCSENACVHLKTRAVVSRVFAFGAGVFAALDLRVLFLFCAFNLIGSRRVQSRCVSVPAFVGPALRRFSVVFVARRDVSRFCAGRI